ncbi:hypothetical protein BGZ90_006241, partial [Linnemannia elongata]
MATLPLQKTLPLIADNGHTTSTPALENHDILLKSLEISKAKPLPAPPQVTLNVFSKNMSRPAIKTDLPRPQQRIERTDQLIYCSTLLLRDSLLLSSADQGPTLEKAELAWVAEMKNDPMEHDRLQWLTTRMVEASIQDTIKDSNKIAEIVALGPILQKEPYRKL